MNGRTCDLAGYLPASPAGTPALPCERGLYRLGVGCNQLECPDCGHRVGWTGATWACGCRTAEVRDVYLGAQDHDGPPELLWACAGHPDAGPEDLRTLGFGPDLHADLEPALSVVTVPRHHPVGHAGYLTDLRLDLGAFDAEAVRARLLEVLDGDRVLPAWRAMHVLHFRGWTPTAGAVERWRRLRGLPNPRFPALDLGRTWARHVGERARATGERSVIEALVAAGAPDLEWLLEPS